LEIGERTQEINFEFNQGFSKRGKIQISRSNYSVLRFRAANVAERFGRYHYQENIQFCRQARGSLNETLEHLICAFDEGFITEEEFKNQKAAFDSCLKLLNGYIGYLKKAVQNK